MDLEQHYLALQNARSGLRCTAKPHHTVAPEVSKGLDGPTDQPWRDSTGRVPSGGGSGPLSALN
jgi:hypothetical protein